MLTGWSKSEEIDYSGYFYVVKNKKKKKKKIVRKPKLIAVKLTEYKVWSIGIRVHCFNSVASYLIFYFFQFSY